jgi:hypothetical protein
MQNDKFVLDDYEIEFHEKIEPIYEFVGNENNNGIGKLVALAIACQMITLINGNLGLQYPD